MTEPTKSDGEAVPNPKWKAQARWAKENPLAKWSHSAVRSAIKRGLIEPEPCEVCGEEPADAHHDDHRQPLEIRWLCRKHHRQHHAEQRRGEVKD